jgi:preprotein translocase subunit SecA
VDSILIDEARTPLIISGPVGTESDRNYADFNAQVAALVRRQTSIVNDLIAQAEPMLADEKTRYDAAVKLHQAEKGIPKNKRLMKLLQDSEVKQLVQRVELDYIAERKLPTRQQQLPNLEGELFFVMDERGRSVHLTDRGVEAMSPGDPTLFVMPDISEEIGRLEKDPSLPAEDKLARRNAIESEYAAKSEKLHIIHKLLQAHALYEKDVEYVVQEGQVFIVDEFTGRIMAGRRWSDGLHQAIEAKENVVVQGETQTLATITIQNYFRMYEKLAGMTGTAETEETEFFQIYGLEVMVIPTNRPVRRVDKHDLIYKTRREKYNAVVEEAAREHERGLPVLVGTVSVEVSETLSRMLKRKGLKHEVLNAKQHQREAEIVANAGRAGAITIATNMAGRGTDIKLGPGVRQCQVCGITAKLAPFGQQREKPDLSDAQMAEKHCNDNPPCGLVIIGTERHESRRIDRQLRGRSGRQGDPGQSVFFLSLEDDLMRLFGSDRIARWMGDDESGESEVIQHPWVTRAIEGAQKRVELQNFQARKRLLDYDDVMNQQREVVYDLRLFALEGGEELKASALKMIDAAAKRRVEQGTAGGPEEWDRKLLATELLQQFMVAAPAVENAAGTPDQGALVTAVQEAARQSFQRKLATLADTGRRYGIEHLSEQMLARVMLQVLDEKWKDHLYDLDQLRDAIHYRQWGQKDPLIEYKREAFELFRDLMQDIQATFTERFLKVQIQVNTGPTPQGPPPGRPVRPAVEPSDRDLMMGGAGPSAPAPVERRPAPSAGDPRGPGLSPAPRGGPIPRVGRNDPCPCGSGKKYKKCHGVGT